MAKGFMRISRDKLDSWCWRGNMNKNYLMMYLLVKANFKDEPFETIIVKRGQLVFSYDRLSLETGMPLQTLRTTLRDLEKTNQITTKSTRKWSLLTICEYDSWQENSDKSNTQSVTQTDTQTDTNIINKEIQELKEENKRLKEELTNVSKKKASSVFVPPSIEEVDAYVKEHGYHFSAEHFVSFYASKGWMVGKNKMKDWKMACRTWENKRKQDSPQLFNTESIDNAPKELVIDGQVYR